jgi:hypothetical protein
LRIRVEVTGVQRDTEWIPGEMAETRGARWLYWRIRSGESKHG